MLRYITIVLLIIGRLVNSTKNISEIMIEQKVIPDIIRGPPRELLQVTFPHGDIDPGVTLTGRQCIKQPKLNWTSEKDSYYTVMMIGVTPWKQEVHIRRPYLPHIALAEATIEPPKIRKSLHWLVVNIPGNNLDKGHTKQVYNPSIHILESTCSERFILLVFKEKGKCNFDEPHPKLLKNKNSTDLNTIFINTVTYLLDYYFEDENPLAASYFDREINVREDSQFNSADYEVINNLKRSPKPKSTKKVEDSLERVTLITLNPIV
ncbi:putative odorant-binding protein A5 [Planococcus citri]|uniref:putative odorant-binding protein A5 n=1 Tax=Planococcus citri TaxID=170843 RepID=UPI0031F7B56A